MSEIVTTRYQCENPNCLDIYDTTDTMHVVHGNGDNIVRHFCDHNCLTTFYAPRLGWTKP